MSDVNVKKIANAFWAVEGGTKSDRESLAFAQALEIVTQSGDGIGMLSYFDAEKMGPLLMPLAIAACLNEGNGVLIVSNISNALAQDYFSAAGRFGNNDLDAIYFLINN